MRYLALGALLFLASGCSSAAPSPEAAPEDASVDTSSIDSARPDEGAESIGDSTAPPDTIEPIVDTAVETSSDVADSVIAVDSTPEETAIDTAAPPDTTTTPDTMDSAVPTTCGDGIVNVGEECDDKNGYACDGCEACARRTVLVLPPIAQATVKSIASALSKSGAACYEAWTKINPTAPADAVYLSSAAGPTDAHFVVRCFRETKTVSFGVDNGGPPIEVNAPIDCGDGAWHHVAACREIVGTNANLSLFWDGNPVGNATGPASKIGTPTTMFVGAVTYLHYGLGGFIDEIRISNTKRYSSAFVPVRRHTPDASTVALWHLDEGSGAIAKDASGNGHDLNEMGGAWQIDAGYGPTICPPGCLGKPNGWPCDGTTGSKVCIADTCVAATCGDGIMSPTVGEECDDKNTTLCDGCESCRARQLLNVPAAAYARSTGVASALTKTGSACYEAWAKVGTTSPADAIYLSSTAAGADSHFLLRCFRAAKVVSFAVENGSPPVEIQAPLDCGDDAWHHVAGCREIVGTNVNLTLFWDGTKVGSATGAVGKIGTPTTVYIGGLTYVQEGLGGSIDEVRISNVLRYTTTFTPVRRHAVDASTVALWHFDEGNGKVAKDASGSGYDMALSSTSWLPDLGYRASFCF